MPDPDRLISWNPPTPSTPEMKPPVCLGCGLAMKITRVSRIPHSDPARLERDFECRCGAKVTIEAGQ
jgi:hypothetical protein